MTYFFKKSTLGERMSSKPMVTKNGRGGYVSFALESGWSFWSLSVNQLKSVNIWQKTRSKLTRHLRKIKHLWPVKISDSSFSKWMLFFIPWKSSQRWCIFIRKDYSIIKMFLPYRNDRGDCQKFKKKPWKLSKLYHILQDCMGPKLQLRLNLHSLINEKWKGKKNKGSLW